MSEHSAPAVPISRDEELLRAVARGDAVAREELATRLVRRVRRTSNALLASAFDGDDAAQLSMIEILKSAHTFQGRSSVEAWADRITVRTVLRFIRGERKRRDTRLALAREPSGNSPAASPPGEELARPIQSYLQELDPNRRTAVVLRHVLGHSIDEIAALTGVSRNTVKDRLVCARRDLRKLVRRERLLGVPDPRARSA